MKSEKLLIELENLAEKLGLDVRYEHGDFQGDYCIVKEDGIIIIQKKANLDRKIAVLSRGLGRMDLGNIYILPELRNLLESDGKNREEEDEFP